MACDIQVEAALLPCCSAILLPCSPVPWVPIRGTTRPPRARPPRTHAFSLRTLRFAEMPMTAEGFAWGSRAMWKHPAFADMFVSAYASYGDQSGAQRRPPPLIRCARWK